jgi:hypothetical protein
LPPAARVSNGALFDECARLATSVVHHLHSTASFTGSVSRLVLYAKVWASLLQSLRTSAE